MRTLAIAAIVLGVAASVMWGAFLSFELLRAIEVALKT